MEGGNSHGATTMKTTKKPIWTHWTLEGNLVKIVSNPCKCKKQYSTFFQNFLFCSSTTFCSSKLRE